MGILVLAGWFILCLIVGAIGKSRRIGFWGSFLLSLFLSPLIGFIVALVSQRKSDRDFQKAILDNNKKDSISDKLAELETLKKKGTISEEEYTAMRKKALSI
ncbi:hypothetical protein SAMN05216474_2182 [Lishizhenia tianjinensis]|uniref:SHOCT domain-containing protein n=1 Tax=Lishizhenia tianjinensis TaxID=477690 RepID=A0A1I7AKP0_9FLAO|nr:SHOCT domain-containing protein [Lishizhenia tianjinensis]SFT75488.1 hypothetical protein SAMN05216474_2182 [Lishizhenia tianjinensis]